MIVDQQYLIAALTVYAGLGLAYGVYLTIQRWYLIKYEARAVISTAVLLVLVLVLVCVVLWFPFLVVEGYNKVTRGGR